MYKFSVHFLDSLESAPKYSKWFKTRSGMFSSVLSIHSWVYSFYRSHTEDIEAKLTKYGTTTDLMYKFSARFLDSFRECIQVQ